MSGPTRAVTRRVAKLTEQEARAVLVDILDVLYPDNDPDAAAWDAETIEDVAHALDDAGLLPPATDAPIVVEGSHCCDDHCRSYGCPEVYR